MYDHLFFDADGTLWDFMASERWALSLVFTELGIEPTFEAISAYSRINNAVWLEFEQGLITLDILKIERFHRFQAHYGITIDPELSAKRYAEKLAQSYHLYADTILVLDELVKRRYPLSLITNGISNIQRGRLAANGTQHYFEAIIISEEVGARKPDPEYFEIALKMARESGYPSHNPLVIGDSPTSDIRGAIDSGIDTCWINRYGMEKDKNTIATYEIKNLEELLPILDNRHN